MNTRIIVLAGGKGKRMHSETPKVLTPLEGKPIIAHLLDAITAAGIDTRPVVVVGQGADAVERALGPRYEYVLQEFQLGTGHAVRCAEPLLRGNTDAVIVLYGDHPLIRTSTIARLHALHAEQKRVLTMMTATVPDFKEWRAPLADFGRIVRSKAGEIVRIVEKKDARRAELELREVNPSFFCFNAAWLWDNLRNLDNRNAQQEYYLTDLVRIAIDGGEKIASMDINPLESIGVNTPEHLELVTSLTTPRSL